MERKKEEVQFNLSFSYSFFKEAKKQQAIAKRAEKKALEEKENEDLKKLGKATDTKLTRGTQFCCPSTIAAMMEEQRLREQEEERRRREREKQKEELQIEENVNHLLIRQREEYLASGEDVIDARSVGEAISALGVSDGPVDKHPEKRYTTGGTSTHSGYRLKAAFLAYESERLPILRKENPSLKLSQVKELLWREWTQQLKHP